MTRLARVATAAMIFAAPAFASGARDTYTDAIELWRAEREQGLENDDGWLTVAGLFWLEPGANRFGTDGANAIILPTGKAPAHAGTIDVRGGHVFARVEPGVAASSGGQTVAGEIELGDERMALVMGDLTMFVIERGGKLAIRLRDRTSAFRREFAGLKWYPVKADYRVEARWVAYPTPKMVPIPNILGMVSDSASPGYAEFTLDGRTLRLDPIYETPDATDLFFIFKDATSGETTYPAGRFFYSELPTDGRVVLDFNKAYNPPCAFTPFATCPLPPPQNVLPMKVEAGELNYEGKHSGR